MAVPKTGSVMVFLALSSTDRSSGASPHDPCSSKVIRTAFRKAL